MQYQRKQYLMGIRSET